MGLDWDDLGKIVVGNRRMFNNDPFNPGIYDANLTVTSGSAAPNGVGDSQNGNLKHILMEDLQIQAGKPHLTDGMFIRLMVQ